MEDKMPNDKKDGFLYDYDKKTYEFIKKNDPTGLIKKYYEETDLGKSEMEVVRKIDTVADHALNSIKDGLQEIGNSLYSILKGSNLDNNKNLQKPDDGHKIKR